ncbi:hypothetical protein INH39_25600 [Massilia violaceinigra]|uniref:Uncharacterized protein n=1 Tax=Massilia violaceinigra TaxID=2045208 RepID=A0ABY4A213_9BURK|nr:hypothetical protein [Massilia violaceinigra]UOD28787.1 hypothetical protein INH39_25600 [Massilia violaceinigra]
MDEEFFASSRRLVQFLANTSTTWVAPLTTNRLEQLLGRGENGSAGGTVSTSRSVTYVAWLIGGSGSNSGTADWSAAQAAANSAFSAINAGGSVSWNEVQIGQYNNGTYSQFGNIQSTSNVVAGSASMTFTPGWQSSGPITGGGSQLGWSATVNFDYVATGQTNGAAATGFGYTFAGGVGIPAENIFHYNVPVIPGNSYNLVVPPGGAFIFSYLE